ncbi:MAG TPA: HGxxPAAW family protein [Cellulomonadaceae bacterium]|nr:HGxxPAAW family protein [Cellulomonadaceae bacterium]
MAEQSTEGTESTGALAWLPPSAPPSNHGHTVAAWTTTIVVVVGALVSALAVVFAVVWLFWAGLGVVLVGAITGKVLQVLGYGQGGANTLARQSGAGAH